MYQLNNLDVIILIIVGISALIALSRGLMKEVLSIIGWVLGCVAIIYLLPVLNPFTMKYIENGTVAGILTSIVILIVFLVIWILATGKIVSKIRSSKLSGLDRTLGLFFGIARAFLLIILLNILISWIVPKERQSPVFQESKYFNLAGSFAEPLEKLIPEATLETIKKHTKDSDFFKDTKKTEDKTKASSKAEKKPVEKKTEKDDSTKLFEKLARPQVKKTPSAAKSAPQENFEGYNNNERANLDRLIDNLE